MRLRTKIRAGKLAKVGLLLAGAALLGGVVMLLWNWIMPGLVDGVARIDYWRALGLLVLSRILFGGFRGRGRGDGHGQWQRWQKMTPEEREQVLQQCARRGRPAPHHHEKQT